MAKTYFFPNTTTKIGDAQGDVKPLTMTELIERAVDDRTKPNSNYNDEELRERQREELRQQLRAFEARLQQSKAAQERYLQEARLADAKRQILEKKAATELVSTVSVPADRIGYAILGKGRIDMSTPQQPNKVAAADPHWGNKVAWHSRDLLARQQSLTTHSMELAVLFETVRSIAALASGAIVKTDELDFVANFGSPITNNTQKISIILRLPVALFIMLTRALIDGAVKFSADISSMTDTPITVLNRLDQVRDKITELDLRPAVIAGNSDRRQRKQRKVKI